MNYFAKSTLLAIAAMSLFAGACAKKPRVVQTPANVQPTASASTATATPAATPQRTATASQPTGNAAPAQSRYPDAATRLRIDDLLAKISDAYFDYDKTTLRPDAMKALQADATELRDILKNFPNYKLTIEGHADERGSAEYNVALSDQRAGAAKEYLVGIGIPSDQLGVIGYGKERPVCQEHDESCWQRNRRIHIVASMQ